MDIRKGGRQAAFLLAVITCFCLPIKVYAFTPWSYMNGYWISADGKTPIEGVVEKGVTITKYQNKAGNINWEKMKKDNISFAMVLLGYYDDMDPYFIKNMKDADAAGIKTGICFYSTAESVEEARKEARYVLDIVKDYKVSYPIGYDIESSPLLDGKNKKTQIIEQVNAFCSEIEEAGYRAVVYIDNEWLNKYMDVRKIPYDVWYSRYGMANTCTNRTLWRCTDNGSVAGIKGSVCLEFSFENYNEAFLGTGWREINGVEYYFYNYKMLKSTTATIEGEFYSFDRNGKNILRQR